MTRRRPEGPLSDPAFVAGLRPIPSGPVAAGSPQPAADIVGERPTGGRVEVVIGELEGLTLLCFLHVRCDGCGEFWTGLRDDGPPPLPEGVSAVVVTKGPGSVDPEEVGHEAEGVTLVPVVMSDEAWRAYRVTGYPFFVLVDPEVGTVIGETVGLGWSDVDAMIGASRP